MTLKRMSDIAGGSYFKPAEHQGSYALLVEPQTVQRDVPNTYKGVTKNRDEVTGDVTVFATAADLEAGKGVEVKGVTFTHPGIVNKLGRALNEAIPGKVAKKQFTNGDGWIIDEVDDATFDKVAAFYDAREAAVAEALAAAPGFD